MKVFLIFFIFFKMKSSEDGRDEFSGVAWNSKDTRLYIKLM